MSPELFAVISDENASRWAAYAAPSAVLVVIAIGGWFIKNTPERENIEIRKVLLAAASVSDITISSILASLRFSIAANGSTRPTVLDAR